MTPETRPSVVYLLWLKKIVDTHARRAWDEPRSEDQEEEEDRLNELWGELDEAQHQRLWGLSADLHSVRDREAVVEADWEPATAAEIAQQQREAYLNRQWDKLLETLRRPPKIHARDQVDYMRGRTWMEMKHPDVALLFFDNAARLAPDNPSYRVLALECLKTMSAWDEAIRRIDQYARDESTPARLLFRAADALHACATATNRGDLLQRGVDLVDRGLSRLEAEAGQELAPSILAGAYATKAFCLEQLGRLDEALLVWNQAVREFPGNATVLSARGLVRQQFERAGALDDFWEAVRIGTPLAWPYLELARHAWMARDYDRVVALCRDGLERATRGSLAAILFALLGAALRELGNSDDTVRQILGTAAELDPLNPDIRHNIEAFEQQRRSIPPGPVEWRITQVPPRSAMAEVYDRLLAAA